MSQGMIVIKGAREHNLKNINIEIPRNRLVVITGISGSGKSSLAFDTIYAEGQRRYVESLSAYARQFLEQLEKPDVDSIEGLSPAISIEQKTVGRNPRSTVGTVTEIYDFLRLLFARTGQPYCYQCGRPISSQTVQQIVDKVANLPEQTKIQVMAPIVRGRKGEYRKEFREMRRLGYLRARVNGELLEMDRDISLDRNKKHNIEIIIDRLVVKKGMERRLSDSVETALNLAEGVVLIDVMGKEELLFSEKFACLYCGVSVPELSPRMFSFNSPHGACPACDGLGTIRDIDESLVVPDGTKSIQEGAIAPWASHTATHFQQTLKTLAKEFHFQLDSPYRELKEEVRLMMLHGSKKHKITFEYENENRRHQWVGNFEGIIPNLKRRYRETKSSDIRAEIEEYMNICTCPQCHGKRLKPESLAVKVGGLSIGDITAFSVGEALDFFQSLRLDRQREAIGRRILKEIVDRLQFMRDVGLEYLTLERSASTLAGGESQRIRLATQIGSSLVGVLYVLDEPSIGLHQRDNFRLLETLKKLRDMGNTVIVVEHDRETIMESDYVLDLGPGAGVNGGNLVAYGPPQAIIANKESLTGAYLSGCLSIPIPEYRRKTDGQYLTLLGCRENNLKNLNVSFPLGVFNCVTGVSGSGKSTLVVEILYKALAKRLYRSNVIPGQFQDILGIENIDKVIDIDQSPIGRTPRSNPATYTGLFTYIREIFAMVPEARARGYKQGRFSFNVKGGRCEACQGDGLIKIEMHFLPDVYVTCQTCHGKRFNRETLEVKYKGKNVADVLEMTVKQALVFFENIPKIKLKLQTMQDVGLGYITLGQSATTLSGGEAQRIKLAKELSKRSTGKTLYILDEPTTGLHFDDIKKLLDVLNKLADAGNTIIVIEHNLDVIKAADFILDLGPEGGEKGGELIAAGRPEEVAMNPRSFTGQFLKKILYPDKLNIRNSFGALSINSGI